MSFNRLFKNKYHTLAIDHDDSVYIRLKLWLDYVQNVFPLEGVIIIIIVIQNVVKSQEG